MKKNIIYLLLIISTFLSIYSPKVYAWDDCPKGEVDDPYPGDCSRYIDTDDDGICDRSQVAPEDRVAEGIDENTKNEPPTTIPAYKTYATDTTSTSTTADTASQTKTQSDGTKEKSTGSKYNFWTIFISLIIVYAMSLVLSKTKMISTVTHKKLWNVILLITFLLSGITGLLLTIQIDNPALISLPQNFLFLHVEFGVAMALISIFHIIWHWPYYKCIFKLRKNSSNDISSCKDSSREDITK